MPLVIDERWLENFWNYNKLNRSKTKKKKPNKTCGFIVIAWMIHRQRLYCSFNVCLSVYSFVYCFILTFLSIFISFIDSFFWMRTSDRSFYLWLITCMQTWQHRCIQIIRRKTKLPWSGWIKRRKCFSFKI